MAIEVLSTLTVHSTGGDTTSFSHTTDAGTDCLVYSLGSWDNGSDSSVASVTFNGATLTNLITEANAGQERATLLYLVAPSIGEAVVDVIMASGNNEINGGLFNLSGVDQSNPIGATAQDQADDSTHPSLTVTSAVDDLVIMGTTFYNSLLTADSPAFAVLEDGRTGGNDSSYAIGQVATTTSTDISGTLSRSSAKWVAVGAAFQPSGGGPVLTEVSKQVNLFWNSIDSVSRVVSETWDTLSNTAKPVSSLWNGIQKTAKSTETQWSVLRNTGVQTTTNWNVLAISSLQKSTTWNKIQGLSKNVETNWNVLTIAGSNISTTWNVISAFRVAKLLSSSWNVFAVVEKELLQNWDVLNRINNTYSTEWSVLEKVLKNSEVKWGILNAVSKHLISRWGVLQAVILSKSLVWSVSSATNKELHIRWQVFGDDPSLPDIDSGDIFVDIKTHKFVVVSSTMKTELESSTLKTIIRRK